MSTPYRGPDFHAWAAEVKAAEVKAAELMSAHPAHPEPQRAAG
jgi:hypothetical protein